MNNVSTILAAMGAVESACLTVECAWKVVFNGETLTPPKKSSVFLDLLHEVIQATNACRTEVASAFDAEVPPAPPVTPICEKDFHIEEYFQGKLQSQSGAILDPAGYYFDRFKTYFHLAYCLKCADERLTDSINIAVGSFTAGMTKWQESLALTTRNALQGVMDRAEVLVAQARELCGWLREEADKSIKLATKDAR